MKRKRNGFTLIELIAVLVIMAIIALIATPLVMSIIRKARVSADKRSIDAYGRSIELAIAGYLLDTGKFPTEVSQLTIEYSGNEVVCETTQINQDSSVYLAGCTVSGRSVEYVYGTDKSPSYAAYKLGDTVTYNEVDYYVIKDSEAKESKVTLLKAEALSREEITTYSAGTGAQTIPTPFGEMQYHSSSSAYEGSYVKQTVDAWKTAKAPAAIEARLIQYDEIGILGYEWTSIDTSGGMGWGKTNDVPSWTYNGSYNYWTMSPYNDSSSSVWVMNYDGVLGQYIITDTKSVRPVIVLPKSAL